MRASVTGPADGEGVTNKTWCETELKYTEFERLENGTDKEAWDYRLKLHKNGTEMLATYELDEGVEANWVFRYFPGEGRDEVCLILLSASVGGFEFCLI